MAGVSYNQGAGPDVAPDTRTGDDFQHIQASPNAFGAAIAGGAEKLGAGLLQANQFYNASAADQATNNLVDQGTTLLHGDPNKVNPDGTHDTGFFGKQGQDMMDAYGTTHQQLQDMIKNHRENLPSGQAQLEYDRNSRRWLQINEAEMGRAYDTAQRGWMINNNTVGAKQALDDISRHAGDDKWFNGSLENIKTFYGKTAQVHGLGDAGNQDAVRNATRDAWKVRLESINADPNLGGPARAYQLAVEHKNDIGVDDRGVDEGAALVEKYKRGGEEASVVGAIKTGWAKSLNTPTSQLAATGKPGGGPPTGAVVYGDSLGAGVKAAYGYGGDTAVGRNPSQVLAAIQSAPAGSLNGKPVVLSSGASNDPSSTDKTSDQIAAAVAKGANPADITVMGVGDRPDLKGVNEKLQAIATKAGAKFLPIDPAKLSGDHIHPASYQGILGGGAAAVPSAPTANFEAAKTEMNLTPQEQALYQRHLTNLSGPGGVDNADGSRSTLLQTTIEANGKTYNIPTVWGGKILSGQEAIAKAKAEGLDKFPSYPDEATAEARYQQMHAYMEKDTGSFLRARNAPAAPSSGAPAGTGQFAPGSFQSALGRTFKEEGGYAARDANGAAVNFGINQAAHPEVNVATMTREQAAQIYKHDYWDAIEGDTLSKSNPALAHVAFDSAVIAGPTTAKRWMLQSGGDPSKFMDLRDRFLEGLIARDPGKYGRFATAWRNRDADLRADIGLAPAAAGGFSPSGVMGAPYIPYTPSPSPALEGAVIQPASVTTPAAEGAKPIDAPPEPETPEEKIERLGLIRDATLASALAAHPEWSFEQTQRAQHLAEQEYMQASIATQLDAHTRKVKKDALGGKALDAAINGRPDEAFAMINDKNNGLTSSERWSMSKGLETEIGQPNPATLGPGYSDALKRVLAPVGSEDRIGIGDVDKVYRMVGNGLTMRGAKEILGVVQGIQKSVDEFGNQIMIHTALERARDKIFHEEDIGSYHTRPPQAAVDAREAFTNKFLSDYNKYREKGYDPKGFNLFNPEEADKEIEAIYPLRKRMEAQMAATHEAQKDVEAAPPIAPSGIDARAWNGMMQAPPIMDPGDGKGVRIIDPSVWGAKVNQLLQNRNNPQAIAAFNKVFGKAQGGQFDAATLIEGLTGHAPDLQQGSGAPTPRPVPPPVRGPSLMDRVGGALSSAASRVPELSAPGKARLLPPTWSPPAGGGQ